MCNSTGNANRKPVKTSCVTQTGLKSLKCLAFLEDDAPVADERCSGTYAAGHLETALRPSELLTLRLADTRREARIVAARGVPFR